MNEHYGKIIPLFWQVVLQILVQLKQTGPNKKEVKPTIVLLNIEQCDEDCETIVIFVFDHMYKSGDV